MNARKTRNRFRVVALASALIAAGTVADLQAQATRPALGTGVLGIDTTSFDRSIRPQDDFFRFVNGSWLRRTEIPADRSSYGGFAELRDRSEQALREIVEEAMAVENAEPGSDVQKIGDLYRSFMDEATIEAAGIQPIRGELEYIGSLESHADLVQGLAHLRRLGVSAPFAFGVGQDAKRSDRYAVYLSQSGLGLPDRDYYLREGERFEAMRAAYVDYIRTLLELAGQPEADAAAMRVLALETALAEHHWTRTANRDRDATYNKMSISELRESAPAFDWSGYLAAGGLADVDTVIVRQPDYLPRATELLAATQIGAIREYLAFHALDQAAPLLSSPFDDAHFEFRGRTLQGLREQRPRWKRGVGMTERAMGELVGRLYVERHFSPEAKERMGELVANLREAFRLGIENLDWMSEETKLQAQDKLARFTVKIGYPDEWEDYSDLEIRPDDLVGNMRRASQRDYRRMIERLGQPVDRGRWGMTPQTVNAYYSSTNNEIVFPAAILQPPFFNLNADDAVNYGAIGGVIGHEISHGFDDQGRKSDGEGNLRDWWTAADAERFEARAEMLVEQYSRYNPVDDLHVNGRLTLGENIGDLSGLAIAYQAYRLSLGGEEPSVIDGFTGDQRFFMGWAQVWRSKYRDEALRQQVLTDPHSPAVYRVNGVVVNLPAFYEAFNVQPGDGMYVPEEQRVKIW
jgi:putative endopeptidase